MKVEGETAYCVDINTYFKNGYKTRVDASTRMSADRISDVALSLEYVKQCIQSHSCLERIRCTKGHKHLPGKLFSLRFICRLHALDFTQKISLWIGVLKDGFDYKEFEWLYGMISEEIMENRIEWELALYSAMRNLKYTIQISEQEFKLYDARLKRRYLNFNSRQPPFVFLKKF